MAQPSRRAVDKILAYGPPTICSYASMQNICEKFAGKVEYKITHAPNLSVVSLVHTEETVGSGFCHFEKLFRYT